MKIVRFATGGKTGHGIWNDDSVQSLDSTPYSSYRMTNQCYQLRDIKLLPPCLPSKVVALGLNYHSHAQEMKIKLPDVPLLFLKPSTSVIGPEDNIVYPESSEQVDYEGELGVVIKSQTSKVTAAEAMSHVLGYTCFNDVTARDLQAKDKQWTRAKGFDTFAAIGPCIETELDPGNVELETLLNGEPRQKFNTNDLIFPIPELISFISHIMTLLPGDIIATGTSSGIGPMQRGDTVEIRAGKIGTLRNYVI